MAKFIDFDEKGRAHVSEQEFMDYLYRRAVKGDYTKETECECEVGDKDWRYCECLNYYNSFGCLLAQYNRSFNYGRVF